jgi:hypothetical protein
MQAINRMLTIEPVLEISGSLSRDNNKIKFHRDAADGGSEVSIPAILTCRSISRTRL